MPRAKVGSNLFILPQLLPIVKHWVSLDFEKYVENEYPEQAAYSTMNCTFTRYSIATCALVAQGLFAQITPASQITPAPVPYTSVSQLNGILSPLQQASESTQADLSKLRIEKWKTDSGYKKQLLGNVDSIKRNLQSALPEIIAQLQNSPEDLSVTFKLYRNLDALYDVIGSVAESAGAFGSKDEFQALSNDLNAIERNRRALGERLENLSTSKEQELSQLRNQVRVLQASVPATPPKKIIVDDNEPKKPASKKKAVPKPPKAVTPAQPASTPPASQPKQ
jgi:hypothetical protein